MPRFHATIELIGINPFVFIPETHLRALLRVAGRSTSPVAVTVGIAGQRFVQNLVKYQGHWRLYLNMPMRKVANKEVGDRLTLEVEFDPLPRIEPMLPELERALEGSSEARTAFEALVPSRRKEILRYLNQAKSDVTRTRNVVKVVQFLLGKEPPGLAALGRKGRERR